MIEFESLRTELTDKFELIEIKRIAFRRKQRIFTFFLIGFIIIGFILTTIFTDNPLFGAFPAVILVLIFMAIRSHQKNKISRIFKTSVLIPAIKKAFPHLTYRSNPGIDKRDFVASTIYSNSDVDRYTSEDLFEGKHGETHFRFCEVHAERRETRSNGKGGSTTHYVTIFRGVFMIADFNKKLAHTTRIIQARDNFFERLFKGKSKVSLEDPIFEGVFNTYSTDQTEARYILSPSMMERIVKLQKVWDDRISLSFTGNHIYIAINHAQNMFEPDLNKDISIEQVERVFNEINACLSIIDQLDLNTRIWTK